MIENTLAKQVIEFSAKNYEGIRAAFSEGKVLAESMEAATKQASYPFRILGNAARESMAAVGESIKSKMPTDQRIKVSADLQPTGFDLKEVISGSLSGALETGRAFRQQLSDYLKPPSSLELLARHMDDLDRQLKVGVINARDYGIAFQKAFEKAVETSARLEAQERRRLGMIADGLSKGAAFRKALEDAYNPPSTLELLKRRMVDLDAQFGKGSLSARDYNRGLVETFGKAKDEIKRLADEKAKHEEEAKQQERIRVRADEDRKRKRDQQQTQEKQEQALATVHHTVTGFVGGFVRQGIASSAQGQIIGLQFAFLSREIASLFLPAIQQATRWLGEAVTWFRNLSGAQQDNIGRWLTLTIAGTGAALMLPKLVEGFKAVKLATLALTGNPLLGITAGIVGLMASTTEGRETLLQYGEAVASIAESIMEILGPSLEALAGLIATPTGQFVAFATIIALSVPKIISGVMAMVASFATLKGAILGGLGILIGLFALVASSTGKLGEAAGKTFVDGLVREVKAGRKTLDQARKELEFEQRMKREEAEGEVEGFDPHRAFARIIQEGHEREERERLEKRLGAGHRSLEAPGGPFEDVRRTWNRLVVAAIKLEDSPQEKTNKWLELIYKQMQEEAARSGKKAAEPVGD